MYKRKDSIPESPIPEKRKILFPHDNSLCRKQGEHINTKEDYIRFLIVRAVQIVLCRLQVELGPAHPKIIGICMQDCVQNFRVDVIFRTGTTYDDKVRVNLPVHQIVPTLYAGTRRILHPFGEQKIKKRK